MRKPALLSSLLLGLGCDPAPDPEDGCAGVELAYPGLPAYPGIAVKVQVDDGRILEQVQVANVRSRCDAPAPPPCHPSGITWDAGFVSDGPVVPGVIDPSDVVSGGNVFHTEPGTCVALGPVESLPVDSMRFEVAAVHETCVVARFTVAPTLYEGIEGAELGDVQFLAPRCPDPIVSPG